MGLVYTNRPAACIDEEPDPRLWTATSRATSDIGPQRGDSCLLRTDSGWKDANRSSPNQSVPTYRAEEPPYMKRIRNERPRRTAVQGVVGFLFEYQYNSSHEEDA